MRVLVDTTIWSLALRRRGKTRSREETGLVRGWEDLVRESRIVLLGVIRQEILSGVADQRQFERLREALSPFPDEPVSTQDHVRAAQHSNQCRAAGIAGSPVDFLITSVSERLLAPIFTTDRDFTRFSRYLPIHLFVPSA